MNRTLNKQEEKIFIENRGFLHEHLAELQADLEDMTDRELIKHRDVLLERVNLCMGLILETDEDNI